MLDVQKLDRRVRKWIWLALIIPPEGMRVKDLIQAAGISYSYWTVIRKNLEWAGIIRSVGVGNGRRIYRAFEITPEGVNHDADQ
jgi:predicted transcriptional regulator